MLKRNFIYNDQELSISSYDGFVMDTNRNSHTSIHGSGGGGSGRVINGYGSIHTSNIKISSTTTYSRDFWLKLDNGFEKYFNFNLDFPVRSGQKVSITCFEYQNSTYPLTLINFDANTIIKMNEIDDFAQKIGIVRNITSTFFLSLLIFAISYIIFNNLFGSLFTIFFSSIAAVIYYRRCSKKRETFLTLCHSELGNFEIERDKEFASNNVLIER